MTTLDERGWQRFWKKADFQVPEGGCWLWTAYVFPSGYGGFQTCQGLCQLAHRLAWEWAYGPIPGGLHVCHKCDVRACVNPEHLFLGTSKDNNDDKMRKGRQARGEMSRRKLTDQAVRQIRARHAQGGIRHRELAATFGVDRSVISDIISRKIWKHV